MNSSILVAHDSPLFPAKQPGAQPEIPVKPDFLPDAEGGPGVPEIQPTPAEPELKPASDHLH